MLPLEMKDPSDFEFRSASIEDVDYLIKFWLENSETANRPTDTPELIEQLILRDPEALIVATYDDRIVGSVIAGWDGWRGSIYRIAIDGSARRMGLGKELIERAEQRLKRLGAERILAMVLESNSPSHAFYTSLGYEKQGEWRRWAKKL